jgi:heme-degrading monooxygenase HmoA
MIQVVWEFVTREMAEQRFVLVFGPGGAWSKLFSDAPGFRGTTLLCDTSDSLRFLVFDLWESALAREEYLEQHSDASSHVECVVLITRNM